MQADIAHGCAGAEAGGVAADIVVVGGGVAGASLAAALQASPYSVAVLEVSAADEAGDSLAWDARIYALSAASRSFLLSIGAWQRLDPDRIGAITRMRVYGDKGRRLDFSAYESGLEQLAWTVEAGALARALRGLLPGEGRVRLIRPARPASLTLSDAEALLTLEGGAQVHGRLLVGAEGAQSFVREEAGIGVDVQPYEQTAVVANFECEKPHQDTAWQWFRDDGVLAWLPLPGERLSMVWSATEAVAADLLLLGPEELSRRVAEAGGHALGDLRLITPAASFALALRSAKHMVARRIALVGDAAHTVHPLAGHGANLGFGDAAVLAAVLRGARPDADPGEHLLLRRYERARAEDIMLTRAVTHGLAKLFGAHSGLAGWARNAGFGLVNSVPAVKNLLVRQASGSFRF